MYSGPGILFTVLQNIPVKDRLHCHGLAPYQMYKSVGIMADNTTYLQNVGSAIPILDSNRYSFLAKPALVVYFRTQSGTLASSMVTESGPACNK